MPDSPFLIGDLVTHPNVAGIEWTVTGFAEAGSIVIVKDKAGHVNKFWARECQPVRKKPIGSFITW